MKEGEAEDLTSVTLPRYLADVIAAEKGFETQYSAMAKQREHNLSHEIFAEHAKLSERQHRRLKDRLTAIGGSESNAKSVLATIFGLVPRSAQLGHDGMEKAVQNLIMSFSIANGEVAMYEALASVAATARDSETESLARQLQEEEREMASRVWRLVSPAAQEAFKRLTHAA